MAVTWVNPRRESEHIRLGKNFLYVTVRALALLGGTTHVNVGINEDGVIILIPGDNYTLSKQRDGSARIGGPGLPRQLCNGGAVMGNYKLVARGKHWEAYPLEVESPQPQRKRGGQYKEDYAVGRE